MERVLVTIPEGAVKDTFLPLEIREYLQKYFDTTYNLTGRQLTKNELKEQLQQVDAVITGWGNAMLDKEVLEDNERLKLIVHTGGTVGNLVDSYVYQKKIKVISGNVLYAESVAEGTIAYMLMGLRKLPDYVNVVRQGKWRVETDVWEGLLDKKVGIIGMGTISRFLIEMLQVFRVDIKVFSHYDLEPEFEQRYHCKKASLAEIFSTCDVVSVHSALNVENRGLIGKEYFRMLKDGALFINTSRGDVIDEEGLIEELKKDRFRAVVDVFHTEPLEKKSLLRSLPNVYSIPHMAGPTLDRRSKITKELVDEMRRFFDRESKLRLEITESMAKRMTKM